ncbi:hypothetical protein Tco_1297868, partial [Tanacetum coccineum]
VAQSQPSSSTLPVPSTSSPPVQSTPTHIPASIPTPTPIPETKPELIGHTFEEPSPAYQHFSPLQEHAQGQMTMDDLLYCYCEVGQEGKEAGRDFEKEKCGLVTPSKTSGEEQAEDISPTTLEAAKTLSRVASQKPKSIDKGRRYKRRKEAKGKKVATSLDFQEEVSTGYAEGVNIGSINVSTVSGQVSTGSTKKFIPSPNKGQREGKDPMIIEEAPKKTKEQLLQKEASLAEAIRLDTREKEEEATVTRVTRRKERAKEISLDPITAENIFMNFLLESGDMDAV